MEFGRCNWILGSHSKLLVYKSESIIKGIWPEPCDSYLFLLP